MFYCSINLETHEIFVRKYIDAIMENLLHLIGSIRLLTRAFELMPLSWPIPVRRSMKKFFVFNWFSRRD